MRNCQDHTVHSDVHECTRVYTPVHSCTYPNRAPPSGTWTYWQYMPVPEIPTETLLWCYRSCIIQVHTPFYIERRVPGTEYRNESTSSQLGRLVMLACFYAIEVHTIPFNKRHQENITNNRIPGQSLLIMQLPLPHSL